MYLLLYNLNECLVEGQGWGGWNKRGVMENFSKLNKRLWGGGKGGLENS